MDETTEVVSVHTNEITSPADHITFESSRDLDVSIYDVGDTNEPSNKRKKHDVTINSTVSTPSYALEERLHSILCCSVCLDIPNNSVFQCANGHLMCANCLSHLLADARLKDDGATCPNCRCDISRSSCIRNLAVEKAISEMPTACRHCAGKLARSDIKVHETLLCNDRLIKCKYSLIGCQWTGPYNDSADHETTCSFPSKSAGDLLQYMKSKENDECKEMIIYKNVFNLLSLEKITFSDLQLRSYRSDDYISKLHYETARFNAFSYQWTVKARVAAISEGSTSRLIQDPTKSTDRRLEYQLIAKSKLTTPASLHLQYVAIEGPYERVLIKPQVYAHNFTNDAADSQYRPLPMESDECNRLLSGRSINIRLILFQLQS